LKNVLLGRRSFLIAAAATALGTVSHDAAGSEPVGGNPTLAGIIQRIGSNHIELVTANGTVTVRFVSGATFRRDDRPTRLAEFVARDRVVAELLSSSEPYVAGHLESLYRLVDGDIVSRRGDQLVVTSGVVWLDKRTPVHRAEDRNPLSWSELVPGREVGITALYDPPTRRLLARDIAVEY
jgi:hypothetical protein